MRVLVTGGAGFIGAAVVAALRARGHEGVAYDLVSGGDVRDRDAVGRALDGVDAVCPLADALAAAHGGPAPVVTGEYRLGDVRHITADSARVRRELAWKPEVGFEEGVREFATAAGLRDPG